MVTERCLADFEGAWTLVREIVHADGTTGRFEGTARFAADANGLAYEEAGALHLGRAHPLHATQRYRWGHDLAVYFDDGRFFHHVPPAGGDTGHWCDPDQYDGHYDFSGWPAFTVSWRVTGPRKAYRMRSRYVRAGNAPNASRFGQ
ncbi:MAG: DUF6314 family protein [Pseudomonadota bacterium]